MGVLRTGSTFRLSAPEAGAVLQVARPGAIPGWADPCRRFLDQLCNGRRGDEPPAAQNDARQVTRTKELVIEFREMPPSNSRASLIE